MRERVKERKGVRKTERERGSDVSYGILELSIKSLGGGAYEEDVVRTSACQLHDRCNVVMATC